MNQASVEYSRQMQQLEQLGHLLEEEEQCLMSGQLQELQRITQEKTICFDHINEIESRRSPITNIDDLQRRQSLLTEIIQKNQRNGQIIGALERFNQGAWQILFGAGNPLYTDLGKAKHAAQRHLIGSA